MTARRTASWRAFRHHEGMARRLTGTAVILHGAGSDATFIRSAFAQPLASVGLRLIAPEDRTGDPALMSARLRQLMARCRDVRIVGGVSVGAHAVLRWAARDQRSAELDGLLIAMPAWIGRHDNVADLTAGSAHILKRDGVSAELLRMRLDQSIPRDWVMTELSRSWPRQADTLADTLLRTATSRGPYLSELSRIALPVGIAALADDPLHPVAVARAMHRRLRQSRLHVIDRSAPAESHSAIGYAALDVLMQARQRSHF